MSGTRSHFQRAPATDAEQPRALIVAHGQPSDPYPAEAALAELTTRVQACLHDVRITSATMANSGVLECAVETLPNGAPIYPLFMADGWFVKTALAKRLEGRSLRVLPPLGLEANLPDLVARAARQTIKNVGLKVADTHIVLAAHGSAQGQEAARSARCFADRLSKILPCAGIAVGFIEEAPYLATTAAALAQPALCIPFFAMNGEHVRDDIPAALTEAGFTGPVLPPFGQYNAIPRLIADTLRAELSKRNAA